MTLSPAGAVAPLPREILTVLNDVRAYLIVDRDALYDSVTNVDGEYDSEDDREAVAEADELLDRVTAAIAALERLPTRENDPLGEALNSGDGVYRP